MYAKYTYLNTATIQQIYDDIFEIFCGETTVGNLSASCDDANTSIITTYSTSPWVDYDSATGDAAERIMRMEMDDDTGVYKTVGWHHDGVDDVAFSIMASWNTGTNIATSEVVENYDKEGMRTVPGSGGVMHIYSSQYCTVIMHESSTSVFGSESGDPTYGSLGIFECSRDHPSLAVGDMPNWCLSSTAMFWGDSDDTMTCTFWKGRDETNTVQTPFTAQLNYPGRDMDNSDSDSYAVAGALDSTTAMTEIGAGISFGLEPIMVSGSFADITYDSTTFYGNISSRCDIWMMAPGTVGCGSDLVTVGGPTPYIVFKAGYTAATAGAQYGGKFIVPYG